MLGVEMSNENLKSIPGVYTTDTVSDLEQLIKCKEKFDKDLTDNGGDKWIFRGQESARWGLKSTFERAKPNDAEKEPWKYEAAILREFTRRAHHYITDLPKSHDILEWFSLMRHYGAPCRLVDFTYSFYVSAYFAVKNLTADTENAAIWAVNLSWLKKKVDKIFPEEQRIDFRFKKPSDFSKHFLNFKNPRDFVAPVNPFRMNQKLTAQQGIFLCPGNINTTFMDNLLVDGKPGDKDKVIRIPLSSLMKREVIKHLRRMNINSATLFPDLAGFAEYLSDWFYLPLTFNDGDLIDAIEGRFPSDKCANTK